MKTLLIFDIDGTLTDSVAVHQSAFKSALQQFGFSDFDENWNNYLHHTDSYIFKTIFETKTGKQASKKDITEFENILTDSISDSTKEKIIQEITGAKKFLKRADLEYQCDIVFATGSFIRPAKLKLYQAEIDIDEQLLIASNDSFSREELIERAIKNAKQFYTQENYDQIILFGDGRWDYETAKKLNLNFIGINNRDLIQMGVDKFFPDFSDAKLIELFMDRRKRNFKINSADKISSEFLKRNISDFNSALYFIRHLKYRRNKNKHDLSALFADGCGTCSTKHALLKQLAIENNQEDIKLFIGLFKMNSVNTPEAKYTLEQYQLDFIPEAHCYLKTGNDIVDVTKINSRAEDFVHDLIEEIEILPEQITDVKVNYHKNHLQKWLNETCSINYSLDELWRIREQCIKDLETKNRDN